MDNNGALSERKRLARRLFVSAADTQPATANDAFWWLFPNYLQSEQIFAMPVRLARLAIRTTRSTPLDRDTRSDTLKARRE